MLILSKTTWVLITGLLLISPNAISFLKVALSNAYKAMLESIKKSALIGFVPVKFKIAHINTVLLPKVKSFFSFNLARYFFFNSKGNNFYLLTNKFLRKFNGLLCIGRYNNFSDHTIVFSQIYK